MSASSRGVAVLVFVLCLCAWWRWSYVPIVYPHGFGHAPWLAPVLAVLASMWIDVIVIGLAWLGFTFCARRRLWGSLGRGALLALLGFVAVARISDYGYYFYSGGHMDLIALQHAQGDAMGMALDAHVTKYALVGGGLSLAAVVLLLLTARGERRALPLVALGGLAVGSVGADLVQRRLYADEAVLLRRAAELRSSPETAIPLLALGYWTGDHGVSAVAVRELHPVVRKKLKRFGIEVDPQSEFPLVKPRVFDNPLALPRTPKWIARPNVIVLFFESFSADLTSLYDGRYPGLTPNLEDFAKRSLIVSGVYNSSTPTVMALTCSYCSYLPVTNTTTWFLERNNSGKTRLRGLPHILGERGWQTTHVHTLDNTFVRTGEALTRMGFAEVAEGQRIGDELDEQRVSWGFSDEQMFRYLVRRLENGKHVAPFLLSAATIDSHAPFHPGPTWARYRDGAVPLLDAIHTSDRAFGIFWDWFKASPLFDTTIVIVLADHAMFPGKEHADARPGEDIGGRYYDRIAFGIYNPCFEMRGRSSIIAGQIDLAPSVLHMLDINVPNHFEGASIFGARRHFPELIGMHEFLFATVQQVGGQAVLDNFKIEDVENSCAGAVFDASHPLLTRCEYFHFYEWKKSLHVNNRIWPEDNRPRDK